MRPPAIVAAILAALIAAGFATASAQEAAPDAFGPTELRDGRFYRTSKLMGQRIRVAPAPPETGAVLPDGTVAGWDDVGEIGDFIVGADGALEAVVVDVGGFLGLAEKEVPLRWSALRAVREAGDAQTWYLVLTVDRAALEAADAVTPKAQGGDD